MFWKRVIPRAKLGALGERRAQPLQVRADLGRDAALGERVVDDLGIAAGWR